MPISAVRDLPAVLLGLAEEQGWALTRLQLLAGGVTDRAISAQIASCRWQIPVPGVVVLFTGPLPRRTRLWVAVLHGGDDAVLSHETAAEDHAWIDVDESRSVHILIGHGRRVRVPSWIVVHRTRLPQPERAVRRPGQPPMTCAEDTVLDLLDECRWMGQAMRWVFAAFQSRSTTSEQLRQAMGRRRRVRYRRLVKDLCTDVIDGVMSPLERDYRDAVERPHSLPTGKRQRKARLGGSMVYRDVDYDDYDTLVELDGRRGHEGEENTFRDRQRDNAAQVAGKDTLRFGWTDVRLHPCECARQVAAVLRRNGWRGLPTRCGPTCTL